MNNYLVVDDIKIVPNSFIGNDGVKAVEERFKDEKYNQDYRYKISYINEKESDNIITVRS